MRKCPVQEICTHLEVCEIFETCRAAEHMTLGELDQKLAGLEVLSPEAREICRIIVDRESVYRTDDDFIRKARAM